MTPVQKPMADIVIVQATPEDAQAIADLNHEQLHKKTPDYPNFKWDTLEWITEKIEGGHFYVAKDSKGLIGAMCVDMQMHSRDTGIIDVIAVRPDEVASPDKPGRGVGTALVHKAEDVCRARGAEKLIVLSLDAYGAAGFYKKCGFDQDAFYFEKPIGPRQRVRLPDGSGLRR